VSFFSRLRTAGSLAVEGHLPGFDGATGWLNSPPLSAADLDGKVVLVDFWTYTCINWLRTLAFVRGWAERYADLGLVVVGVHTPEFPFERDVDNVRQAVKDMAVHYPVALDSDYAIWQAFANRFWPAIYIADAEGRIRHHQFGEGGYAECEMVIQRLLGESGRDNVPRDLVSVAPTGLEAQADWASLKSPESYLGYEQARGFASPGDAVLDQTHRYVAPDRLISTTGLSQGIGPSSAGPACSTAPVAGSSSGSTPATSTSSWDRSRKVPPCRSAYLSTANLPARHMGSMLMTRAAEPSTNNGSISSFASQDQLTTAPSR
jgi:thiol-disulfide isomerase/thioredoxin